VKHFVLISAVLVGLLLPLITNAAPIFFTNNPTLASDNKELMADMLPLIKEGKTGELHNMVGGLLVFRAVTRIPKGTVLECIFDCGDLCLARVIDTTYDATELIDQEFWFIRSTLVRNDV